nr:hypothetical protein [Tanacetum cinerariifolium]
SPIPVKDSDSLMKEIDLSFTPDYPMPPGIEDDDYDSERDILILKDLPSIDTPSPPEIESFHFDIPSFSRPPAKPPDDLPKEKIYSNPLFEEEIIPMKIDLHPFNTESDLIESMLNHDSSIIISLKIDSLLDEFAGELTLLKSIPSGIDETDCSPEEETHFT